MGRGEDSISPELSGNQMHKYLVNLDIYKIRSFSPGEINLSVNKAKLEYEMGEILEARLKMY